MSEVVDNKINKRFELHIKGQIAFADYKLEGKTIYINHVETPESLRGTGIASTLMQGVYELAKKDDLKLIPICSYAVAWIRRHI